MFHIPSVDMTELSRSLCNFIGILKANRNSQPAETGGEKACVQKGRAGA